MFGIWHMFVYKRKHPSALKANIIPVSLELVPSVHLLNEYRWLHYVPALESILAPKALYTIVKSYHSPQGIVVQQRSLNFPPRKILSLCSGMVLGISF